jgi:energy-coupling factor transporter ATP-binding protein EcfA2
MVEPNHILEVADLHVHYPDGTRALEGVSFAMPPAQRVGLIGPNGAGKTSLMLAVMRGLDFTGRIVVDGIASSRAKADELRSRCGLLFQDADDQLFMPTLLDDAAFGPLNQHVSPPEARARAMQSIATVGLAGLEMRPAHHLSGGQKRCAALATILAMRVKLLLMDEPGANLDFRSRKRLLELLQARPEALLLATHDLDMVAQLCSRVIVLDSGKIAADGPTDQILANRALLAAHGLCE